MNNAQIRETIGVLKILMSISMLVTISLIAWAVQNSNDILFGLALIVATFISVVSYKILNTILNFIQKLGEV
ncbi:hypothetical protein SPONN_88 [uncultured Candidatus Thioglobus sp.]|nr:hypothetical protein SPONN_88 [uncultured Candidatus Thioglobus sp.]